MEDVVDIIIMQHIHNPNVEMLRSITRKSQNSLEAIYGKKIQNKIHT